MEVGSARAKVHKEKGLLCQSTFKESPEYFLDFIIYHTIRPSYRIVPGMNNGADALLPVEQVMDEVSAD